MSNQAAFIKEKGAKLNVDKAEYPTAGPGQVVIKNGAVAINPVDWKMQDMGYFVQSWPAVFGSDLAGEVVEVGPDVTTIKKGQRVLGHAVGLMTGKVTEAAYQLYTAVPAVVVSPIPDSISFADASVLPLATSTAAAGLYEQNTLALPLPSAKKPQPSGDALLLSGGSSSVGSSVIQLAVASGLTVIATASKHNFEYVKKLGAEAVVDHSSANAVQEIVDALKGKKVVGAYDAIGYPNTIKILAEVLEKTGGGGTIATVLPPPEDVPASVKVASIFGLSILQSGIAKTIYGEYLPEALASGALVPAPKANVVGKGLDQVQVGIDELRKGVSAKKLVVELP